MKPGRFLRFWKRLRRRVVARLTRMTVRKAAALVTGPGLFLTRKVRQRAKSSDAFWKEFNEHRRLERNAERRFESDDGWLTRRRDRR